MRARGLAIPDAVQTHSIAARVEQLDAELNAGIEATKAQRAIAEADPDGPRSLARKRSQVERTWCWDDETKVAHDLADVDGRRTGYAGCWVGGLGGGASFGDQLERARDGVAGGGGGRLSYDPASGGSAHHAAAVDVWLTLSAAERLVLATMFGDLIAPRDRGPRSVAAKVREFMREGAIGSARQVLEPDPRYRAIDLEAVTPLQLAAIKLHRLEAAADVETKATVTKELSLEVRAARRVFRDRLRQVDVNACLERLADSSGIPRDRRPYLIPPAPLAELEAQRAHEERVCIGPIELGPVEPERIVEAIVAGERPHCGSTLVTADVSSWPRCEVCRRPKQPFTAVER